MARKTTILGVDLGTSAVKAALIDTKNGRVLGSASHPEQEAFISSPKPGWAEQDPEAWWRDAGQAVRKAFSRAGVEGSSVAAIGISYQMHGLVLVDSEGRVLRPAILWCDGRAADQGARAARDIGQEKCLSSLYNLPGNFTAAKLGWVLENEPQYRERIRSVLLPGDYLAMRLTGMSANTVQGLSEGGFWDFPNEELSGDVLRHFRFERDWFPDRVPCFGDQGVTVRQAEDWGIPVRVPVSYRAGDQPNVAMALSVLDPGEAAAGAGTSGVVYSVTDKPKPDPKGRVHCFAHVNHRWKGTQTRLGILFCLNGAGSLYRWLRNILGSGMDYPKMNALAASVRPGSGGVVLPFGNGAERMLGNRDPGCEFRSIRFSEHSTAHVCRAALEGVAFAMNTGLGMLEESGTKPGLLRAARSNLFLSTAFTETLASVSGIPIELFDTDGAVGAAFGAGVGIGCWDLHAMRNRPGAVIRPEPSGNLEYQEAYHIWKKAFAEMLKNGMQDDS